MKVHGEPVQLHQAFDAAKAGIEKNKLGYFGCDEGSG